MKKKQAYVKRNMKKSHYFLIYLWLTAIEFYTEIIILANNANFNYALGPYVNYWRSICVSVGAKWAGGWEGGVGRGGWEGLDAGGRDGLGGGYREKRAMENTDRTVEKRDGPWLM